MKSRNLVIGFFILVAALVVGFVTITHHDTANPKQISAVSGPDTYYACTSNNGVQECNTKRFFTVSTTTVCAIQAPTSGTSTLRYSLSNFVVSSTTASVITFAKATTAFASTTVIATSSIAANAMASMIVSTTTSVGDTTNGRSVLNDRVFAPGNWLVETMSGGTGTFSPTGNCQASFQLN